MNPLLKLGIGVGVILGAGYLFFGNLLLNLSFKMLAGIRYVPQSNLADNISQQKISFDAVVNNPTKASVQLQGFTGQAYFNGQKVSDITITETYDIPANTNFVLKNINLSIPTVSIVSDIMDLIANIDLSDLQNSVSTYLNGKSLNVKGTMKAGGFTYPVDETQIIKM